jgi:uncharacterized protein (DUF1501 family)
MKRRSFVKNMSLATFGIPFAFRNTQYEAIAQKLFNVPKINEDRVLILIRLNGGNDGLNTVVPLNGYDNLMIQRPNIILPENDLIPVLGNNGFHPAMTGMASLMNDGKLSVIQNVGYPTQNRSHFRSMDIWTTGMMDPTVTTGWLGRNFEVDHPNYPDGYPNATYDDPFAISMGYELSATCQGTAANFSHSVVDPTDSTSLPNTGGTNDGTYYGDHMEYIEGIIAQSNLYGQEISDSASLGNNLSTLYDANNPLAMQLKDVALMISGGLKTKVYVLNVNGFDTHDNQVVNGATTTGEHADLMKRVSDAIFAFQDDIELLGLSDRVAGMTFSEFGRQIASNASEGTDHGDAAPLFLFGNCLDTTLYGNNPVIPDTVTDQAGLPMEIDFRDVYASILSSWFGVNQTTVQGLFEHNVTFHDIIGGCNLSNEEQSTSSTIGISMVYPNPSSSKSTVKLDGDGTEVKIMLFNSMGEQITVIFEGKLERVTHHIPFDMSNYSSGSYVVKILYADKTESISLIKI